jgi:hypothetical protein
MTYNQDKKMANLLVTDDIIAPLALKEFKNNLILAKTVRRDYQDTFSVKTGDTIRINKPVRFTVRSGPTLSIQDIDQNTDTMTISFQDGVDVALTSFEQSLEVRDFNELVIKPAMTRLANKVDQRLYDTTIDIYNAVGTPGTAPNSFASLDNAGALLDSFGIPRDENRFALLKSFDAASLRQGCYNLFNESFNKGIIMRGSLGELAGFDVYSVQNVKRPLYGSLPIAGIGTPLVNGAAQSGASLVTDGWTNSTTNILFPGAIFTIAGVYSVNPITLETTGQLQKFTVTANASSGTTTGPATLSISPSIVLTGPYQNVTNAPADNAAITVYDTHTKNVAYHKEAFTLAMVKLPEGNNGAFQKTMSDPDAGVSLRMTRQYDIVNDRDIIRFDVLYGTKCFPDWATIVMGS